MLFYFVAAAKNDCFNSSEPSVRIKNGIPRHIVDLSASCPRCLAAATEKPNGSDGEYVCCVCACLCYSYFVMFSYKFLTRTHTYRNM